MAPRKRDRCNVRGGPLSRQSDAPASESIEPALRAALRAASRAAGRVSPNPLVGAALEWPDGRREVAYYREFGGPHAEAQLLSRHPGRLPRGTLLYVTLEPCSIVGKTPACVDAILRARPGRIIVSCLDPDPRVAGRGVARLRAEGLVVDVGSAAEPALALNHGFHLAHRQGRALVRLKVASSLDGKLATDTGESQWITSPEARREVHRERSNSDAVVVGAGTLAMDDPELTVRHLRGPEPSKIVIDSTLRTDPRARIWRVARAAGWTEEERAERRTGNFLGTDVGGSVRWARRPRLIVATTSGAAAERIAERRREGWEVWTLPADRTGRVSLKAFARRAARAGLHRLLVEAGPTLAGGLLAERLVDELSLYLGPLVLGGDRGWSAGFVAGTLSRAPQFELVRQRRIGADCWIDFRRRDWSEGLAL